MKWSEQLIARELAIRVFNRKYLVVVPNCGWTGSECDLLVVTENLRIIDVEIKISRSDLKADAKKDKWFHNWDWRIDGPHARGLNRRRREWPAKVWKHYYAMPRDIWTPELFDCLPSPHSGVLLLDNSRGQTIARVERIAKPQRDAKPIDPADAVDIARLASLRMWDALIEVNTARAERDVWRDRANDNQPTKQGAA